MALKPQYIIDVRSQEEFAAGHIENAILIPYTEMGQKIQNVVPDPESSIALYCRTGRRAGIAKEVMERLGYRNVVNLDSIENASEVLNLPIVR